MAGTCAAVVGDGVPDGVAEGEPVGVRGGVPVGVGDGVVCAEAGPAAWKERDASTISALRANVAMRVIESLLASAFSRYL
jgi:hypothetical protein